MKRFEDLLSPVSWLILYLGFTPLFLLVFRPSVVEYIGFFVVDYLALLVARFVDTRLYVRLYPGVGPFFPKLEIAAMKTLSVEQRTRVLGEMMRFPGVRARYCAIVSFVKVIPSILFIVFYWDYPGGRWEQAIKVILCDLVMFSYFYGAIFIENHDFVSRQIALVHRAFDWSEVFRRVQVRRSRWEFEMREAICGAAIWIFMLALEYIVISSDSGRNHLLLTGQIWGVGIGGLMLISRIWYLGRQYIEGGLRSLYEGLQRFAPDAATEMLPLHSLSLLARFEMSFNSLSDRLRAYKLELGRWISFQSEESRFRAVGEVSALIVHDLSAPLHVLKFCTEELRQSPERAREARYMEQLATSSHRALELIDSMKAHLRQPQGGPVQCNFGDGQRAALRLLESQYFSRGFDRIAVDTDARLDALNIYFALPDLIHVLMNLLGNSVQNLLEHGVTSPRIEIGIDSLDEESIVVLVRDNGSGMSASRFEQVTAFSLSAVEWEGGRPGLGLRLVRRLVERYDGNLTVRDLPPGHQGTLQLLKVKRPIAI